MFRSNQCRNIRALRSFPASTISGSRSCGSHCCQSHRSAWAGAREMRPVGTRHPLRLPRRPARGRLRSGCRCASVSACRDTCGAQCVHGGRPALLPNRNRDSSQKQAVLTTFWARPISVEAIRSRLRKRRVASESLRDWSRIPSREVKRGHKGARHTSDSPNPLGGAKPRHHRPFVAARRTAWPAVSLNR